MKIGIVSGKDVRDTRAAAQLMKRIKSEFGKYATICTGGNDSEFDSTIKKYALMFEMQYTEFNPSYTGHKLYSHEPESYYGKGYHPSHQMDAYRRLLIFVDRLFIFKATEDRDLDYLIKNATKSKKKFVVLKG